MICCYLRLVPLLKLEQTKTLKTHLEWIQVSKGGEDVLGFRLRTEPQRSSAGLVGVVRMMEVNNWSGCESHPSFSCWSRKSQQSQ